MKKTLYICNRCNRQIKTEGTRIIPHFFDTASGEMLGEVDIPSNDTHFCLNCTKKMMEEILALPEGEKAMDGMQGAVEQNNSPKKRMRLDTGKVMALHEAGWSNKQIAEEMRVTERQIYQCIRYQRGKNNPDIEPDGKEQEDEE